MPRMLQILRLALLAVPWWTAAGIAVSAEVKITATLEPTEVAPGGVATYTMVIENGQPDDIEPLQLPAGLSQTDRAPALQFQSTTVDGVTSNFSILTWHITASRPGTFVVPPQEVHVDGKPIKSNDARLLVKNNPAGPASPFDPLLTLEAGKREIYVGELIPINVNIYVHRRTGIRRIGLIEVPKDNFAIERFPTSPEETSVSMGGASYRALTFASTLSGLRPGKFKLGPASCELMLEIPVDGVGSRNPYFMQSEPRTVKPRGNIIEMTVLPLPEKGRPKNFSGIVGDFEMTAAAEPLEIRVGDPVSVEIAISGSGNFDSLSMPAMVSPADWKTYPSRRFKPMAPRSNEEAVQNHASFNQVIVPQKVVGEIPAFEFNYFSPLKKQYLTARTAPIPIHIKPVPEKPRPGGAGEFSTGEPQPAAEPREKTTPPAVNLKDIVTVVPQESAWLAARPVLWRDQRFIIWNACALGGIAVLLGAKGLAWFWQRRAAAPGAPARRLLRRLRRTRMDRASFYREAAGFIQAHQGEVSEKWKLIEQKYETLNFSPGSREAREMIPGAERAEVIRTLAP